MDRYVRAQIVVTAAGLLLAGGCGPEQATTSQAPATGQAASTPQAPPQPPAGNRRVTPSGLTIVEVQPGSGERTAKPGDTVYVHYTGRFQSNGQKFDSSHDRGEPIDFVLGQRRVIPGWEEGIAGMKV